MANYERRVYEPSDEVRVFDGSEEDDDVEGSRLPLLQSRLAQVQQRLLGAIQGRLHREASELAAAAARLTALSPVAVLARGYAIATTADGRIATEATALAPGSALTVRLARGSVATTVKGLAGKPPSRPD